MTNLFDLSGKIALVTGAGSGMGRAIAEIMGLYGATVVISDIDVASSENTRLSFLQKNIRAIAIPCDMGKKAEIENLVTTTISRFGKIDILASCVGIAPSGSFLENDDAELEKTMDINLKNVLFLTQKLLPGMVERSDGALIYLASIAAVRGNKNIGLYGISKAGLVQLAKNLAVEFGPFNIRANTISPGLIDTPFSRNLLENETFMQKRIALTPLRRVGTTAEIAGVALMLASKAGAFITGQNIIVDGGTVISDGN